MVFTDLSKAIDCISHELLIANAYQFDIKSLNFVLAYFTNRNKKNKNNVQFQWLSIHSFWCSAKFNTRASSCHHLRMWFVCEYDTVEIASHVNPYHHLYSWAKLNDEVIDKLEIDVSKIFERFRHDDFKANPGKFHFLLSPFVECDLL